MNQSFIVTAAFALAISCALNVARINAADQPRPPFADYKLADSELKVVGIDADPNESFLSLQLDSAGRLFAGCREALFVYEPAQNGLYQPRQLLYRFPKNSWVYGIAIRGTDLIVSTHTAVYTLEGAVLKREGIQPKRLLWGLPMLPYFEEHQGMHAVEIGPDGDLYVSLGDNLVGYGDFKRADHWGHWTFRHGENSTPITTVGAVVRLSPDGSRLVPIARGLRNCCGLAFDSNWNLFGNDNDHESLPDEYVPGRLLYITPHAYYSWPRGWLIEKHPWRTEMLATLNPNLGRYVPTGQAYYDDAFLPEKFRGNLLVAEWGKGVLPRYPLNQSGASFKADQMPFLQCVKNVRPVGVAIGRGGRIFVSSLVMHANEASPVCSSELIMITRADDAPNAPFDAYDETAASPEKLFAELESASCQRRYRAHVELQRRGNLVSREAATRLAGAPDGSPVQSSLAWIAASGGERAALVKLASSPDPNARLQGIRALARFGTSAQDLALFETALTDKNPQVAHAALIATFDRFDDYPKAAVLTCAQSDDSFLRQTAVQLLAEKAPLADLQKFTGSTLSSERMAGVLAAGFRLTVPPAVKPLPATIPLNAKGFNARGAYVDGVADLQKFGPLGVFTMADAWAHKTKTAEDDALFDMLSVRLNDADERIAKEAAFFLRLLKDPRVDAKAASILGIAAPVQTNAPIANAKDADTTEMPDAFRALDWSKESALGDAKQGQALFATRGCAVCHAVKAGDKGGGGPSLAGVAGRFNVAYLVESVMLPSKTVAPMFRASLVKLNSGEVLSGLICGETGDEIEMLLSNGTRRIVKKDAIEKRKVLEKSPMPEGLIQTPAELRDLLAFLIAQKN